MREINLFGEETTTQNVTEDQISAAVKNPNNASVQVYRPGTVITRSNGRKYVMNSLGQFERVDSPKR